MKLCRNKNFVGFILCGALALPCAAQQPPAAYPEKSIRLIVPSPPGGGNDIMARLAAQRLSEIWGKQIVV